MTNGTIKRLENNLREVADAFKKFEQLGFDREIVEIYISHKTKQPIKAVRKMLDSQKEFIDKLTADEVIKKLKNG